jgi:predicted membrane protein
MNQEKEWRGSSVGAIFLILLGLIFLLNNFGVLPWSVWSILWRFWPIIFILWGLQAIFGRSRFSRLIVGLISLIVVLFILALVVSANNQQINDWVKRYLPSWDTTKVLRQGEKVETKKSIASTEYPTVSKRTVKAELGLGKLVLNDSTEAVIANLVAKHSTTFGVPKFEHSLSGQNLEVELSQSDKFGGWFNGFSELRYELSLGMPELLTDLDLELGTGAAELKLKTLRVDKVTIEVGTGSVDVDFSAASVPTSEIKLAVGTGSIAIRLPKEVGLAIKHEVGLGGFSVDNNKLKGDGEYKTSNYDTATVKVAIRGEVGTGSISVERY